MKLSDIRKLSREFPRQDRSPDPQALQDRLRQLGYDPGNLYQELEMESRFVDTHRDTSWSNSNVTLHSHSFCEVLYCSNTCGAEYLVGSDRYRLQKGDIILIPPGVSHRPLLPSRMTVPYKRDVLWLSMDFLDAMPRLFPNDRLYQVTGTRLLRTAGTKWEFLGELFRAGVREAERRECGWEAVVTGNTLQLMIQLRRAMMDRNAAPLQAEKPELLDRVLAYIEENLADRITLTDTAKRFFVSESTISHIFKEKMGTSFYRCVTQRRLIAAKSLIQEGVPLEDAGRRVGFGDHSGFYRAFRQEYGISPRQYRRLQEVNDAGLP